MKKDEYLLQEDQSLIDEFEELGELSTGLALERQKLKMIEIQTRAVLRGRKTMIDLDKSNSKLSSAVLALTIIQVTLALFQVVTAEIGGEHKILTIILFATIFYIIKKS